MAERPQINVSTVLNEAPISLLQWRVFFFCFLVSMLDGFDTQALAFVAPAVSKALNIASANFGYLFSATLLGTVFGAMALGDLADRIGRRWPVITMVILFGVLTLACARAETFEQLLALRFVAGLGLGGVIPNMLAMAAEYAPERRRSIVVSAVLWGFPLGAVAGGLICSPLIGAYGWPIVFYIGGGAPLIAAPFLIAFLPESVRFLALRRAGAARLRGLMRRINRKADFPDDAKFVLSGRTNNKVGIGGVFQKNLIWGSLFLPAALFCSLVLTYLLVNWTPSLLQRAGLPLSSAILGSVALNFGGVLGSALLSRFIDGSPRSLLALCLFYIVAAGLIAATGWVASSAWIVLAALGAFGLFHIGAQLSMTTFAAEFYPTAVRGSGLGWMQAISRIGSLIGPVIGGYLVASGMPLHDLFLLGIIPALLACACLFCLFLLSKNSAKISEEA